MKISKGFTLIELMVVVVIAGLLFAVAVPNYSRYVLKSHRTVAINAVLDLGSREARFYTTNNVYSSSLTALGYATDPVLLPSATNAYYSLSASSPTPTSFIVTATPVGNQLNDTCGAYSYTDLGLKAISSGSVSACWQQ